MTNRHGISLNPTQEELRRLRELWRADASHARSQRLIHENTRLIEECDRLRSEIAALRAGLTGEEPSDA